MEQLISVLGTLAIQGVRVASLSDIVDTSKLSSKVGNVLDVGVLTVIAALARPLCSSS